MNLSPRWVETLEAADLDAVHWSRLGPGNAPDSEILAYTRAHGMILVTHDLDFSAILAASGDDAPSVVQLRAADLSPGALGAAVISALREASEALATGAVMTVEAHRARIRALPLR